ncbi:MAG: hypothetical protein HYY48_07270 [Gammaproteobacteria bacterium]|nr:hypothetical protein [Gammaproteobacteria bacterium]
MINRVKRLSPAFIAAAVALVAGTAAFADALPGTWQAKQARFHFAGFTSQYTCDGLRSKVKVLLRSLGARDDVTIRGGCGGKSFNEPQQSHNVVIGFSIPVLAEGQGLPGETFPAEWREVRWRANSPSGLDPGDCELVEQLREQVLTLFNPRDMKDESVCVPHQLNTGDPDLRMTILVPAQSAPPADRDLDNP